MERTRTCPKQAGINDAQNLLGLTAVWSDFDNDGKLELFVANDGAQNYLYRTDGKGRLKEIGFEAGVALDENGNPIANMGVALRGLLAQRVPFDRDHSFQRTIPASVAKRRQAEFYRRFEHLECRARHYTRCRMGECLLRFRQ